MGSKGSKTTTSTQSQDWGPTEDVANRYRALLDRISDVGNTPYQAYTGKQVADFTPDQLAGFQAIRDASGIQTPYLQQAADYARQGASPISGQQIANYYNPYQQSVVNATMANINETNAQQQQQLQGNAALRGALGGDRIGVAQAELARQQNLSNNSTLAGIQQQGFNTALGAAQGDAARAGQAAYTFGSLGQTAQNLAFNNANALMNTGGLQQQLNQAQLNVPYQQFLQQQAFPYQQAQWLAGLTSGIGSQLGGHSEGSGSTTQPGPSGFGQIFGGLTSGLGLLGQSGAFGSAGWLSGLAALKDGGAVKGIHRPYAAGGTVPESENTLHAQQKALLDGKRAVQMFPTGTKELPLPRGLLRIKTENGVFHYDPAQIDGETIKHLSSIGRENELLGLGPYSKDDVAQHVAMGEAPLAIVERDPEGTEYRAAAGTSGTASDQINEMMPDLEPGNQFYLEEPDTTLSAREAGYADGGGIGSPYKPIVSWVPEIGMTAQPMKAPTPMNVPGASQERGGSPDMAGLSKGLGALGGGLKDLFNKPMDISAPGIGGFEPTGMGETMFTPPQSGLGPIYAAGGTVSGEPFRGYDGGGIVDEPLTFADRFAPAQEALTGGIFDPQGANYSDLEQRLPVASVPLPMARPQPTDAPVMVGTAPTISGETPSALNPSGGINTPYDRPVAYDDAAIPANAQLTQAAPKREIPWAAITAAGLGMLASESPYAGVAIGQGGLQGLKTYAAQQEAERKQAHDLAANAIQQRRVDLEARRLDQIARSHDIQEKTFNETVRQHGIANMKPIKIGTDITGSDIFGVPNPKTGGYDILDPETGQIKARVSNTGAVSSVAASDTPAAVADNSPIPSAPVEIRAQAPAGSPGARDTKFLESIAAKNPGLAKQIQAVADYQLDPNKTFSMRNDVRNKMMRMVYQYDPTYDGTTFPARNKAVSEFATGRLGNQIRSFDVSIAHLTTLEDLATALSNGDTQALNKVRNYIKTQMGYEGPVNFEAAKKIVGDEIAKGIIGGQTALGDREEFAKNISAAGSPQQLAGVMRTFKQLLGGQLHGLKKQYEDTTRLKNFDERLTPVTRKAIADAEAYHAAKPSGGSPASSPANSTGISRPSSVPAGSAYSPSRKMWRSPDGTMFDAAGNRVQ